MDPVGVVSVSVADGTAIVSEIIEAVLSHRDELCATDAVAGDGDHGSNLAPGFAAAARLLDPGMDLGRALQTLGGALAEEATGATAALYAAFFTAAGRVLGGATDADAMLLAAALQAGMDEIVVRGEAGVGDKTLLDTLDPALDALVELDSEDEDLTRTLVRMRAAARSGRDSTGDVETGRGIDAGIDAGASSCYLIIDALGRALIAIATS